MLSVSKIADNGYTVIFNRDGATIRDRDNDLILTAERKDGLYLVTENAETAAKADARRIDKTLKLWHARLGHLNEKYLRSMATREIIKLKEKRGETTNPCKICLKGKITKLPFSSASNRSSKILEIIHTDVCGPMRVNSIGGARYFATFIDDHSRWWEVRFLNSKGEITNAFKELKAMVEKQTGEKIRIVQSDNGREYCNREFDAFLTEQGIKRRLTVPYTLEQNGVAERKNRTLCETARCLIIESKVPLHFWAEAIAISNYLRNRCPSSSIDGKTPFELWVGRSPKLNHLRSFGCKAIALNKAPGKGKFDARGHECILVGYSDTAKAYRVWFPSRKRVEATRDVVFLEDQPANLEREDITKNGILCEKDEESTEVDHAWMELKIPPTPPNNEAVQNERNNDNSHSDADSEFEQPDDPAIQARRGPGRPRILRTGRPGRPRKIPAQMRQPDTEEINNDNSQENYAPECSCVAEISTAEAAGGPDATEWRNAMKDEFRSLLKNNTWEIVDRPAGKNIIGCRIVLRNKYKPDGTIERRKARLVAKGYSQRPGLDFRETFAPVARMNSIRMLTAVAVEHEMEMHQLDITTAYLNGTIDESIHMEVPEFLRELLPEIIRESSDPDERDVAIKALRDLRSENKVCALKRALYGLKQAGRQWHMKLDEILRELGLKPINGDVSVYTGKKNETLLIVATYVDDIIIASSDRKWISEIKSGLKRCFDLRDLGKINHCLGLEFTQRKGEIFVCQEGYAKDLLRRFGMEECNPVATPIDINQKLSEPTEPLNEADFSFRRMIGSLMYLAVCTRPDISYAVNSLSQFCGKFGKEHWLGAKRILRYLKGTIDYGLRYVSTGQQICGFVDADWAGCVKDRKSYTGYAFIMGNAATSWESRKQQTVALSSTEAEYMAIADSTKEAMHVQRFIGEATWTKPETITIFNDNQGSHQLAKNLVFHSRTKHIDVRHHFVRDAVKNENIILKYMPSREMPADVLTKGLSRQMHQECVRKLGVTRRVTDE